LCGKKELKTLLAIEAGDTIAGVARKIGENRETIRRVVNTLEDEGYVEYDDGLHVLNDSVREAGLDFLTVTATVEPPSITEAYVLPHFTSMDFAFDSIDSVYVWTRGGYQVARNPEDYPLFLTVEAADLDAWIQFFERFGIPANLERQPADTIDGSRQVVLTPSETVEAELVDGLPVIPLEETVKFARQNYATFQSALDMLNRMYEDVETGTDHRMETG
jgi:hypothetical protein